MSINSDYSVEDQQVLRASLAAAAVLVSASSPGRKEETVSEGYAAATYVLDSRAGYVANTLVTSIIVELVRRVDQEQPFPNYVEMASADGAGERAVQTLRDVVAVLDAGSAPDEAAGYKGWLMQIGVKVAEAGKEDQGFLGRGGVQVNDAERAALDRLSTLLSLDAAQGDS
jgi:hypothetical protein